MIKVNGKKVAGVGPPGLSPYQVAKAGGYTGTEAEFNATLANIRPNNIVKDLLQEGVINQGGVSAINVAVDITEWENYDYVVIDWEGQNSHQDKGWITGIRINGSNSSSQTYSCFKEDYRELYYGNSFIAISFKGFRRLKFNVFKDLSNIVTATLEGSGLYSWGIYDGLSYNQIQTITFSCSQSNHTWLSGLSFKIYGVNI